MDPQTNPYATHNDPSPPATPRSSIKNTLQQIRGELFDMDSSNVTLVKILDQVQRLTEAENEVVQRQREEIERLKLQLELRDRISRRQSNAEQRDDYDVLSSGSFSTTTDDEDVFEKELTKKAGIIQLSRMSTLHSEIEQLSETKDKIHQEIDALRRQVALLVEERNALIAEVQGYTHTQEMAEELDDATCQIERLQRQVTQLQGEVSVLTDEKAKALNSLESETFLRRETETEMNVLYEEKLVLETLLEDRHSTITTMPSSITSNDTGIERLKREIVVIKAENESLRVSAKREAATIQGLEDEIRSLNQENLVIRNSFEEMSEIGRARCAKRSQNCTDEDRFKNSIDYEPRERLGSAASSGDYSCKSTKSVHEHDNVSVLFGQDSISGRSGCKKSKSGGSSVDEDDASDHKSIRVHAEKLLYWANKAVERNKSSNNSVGSGVLQPMTRQSSVPTTIGVGLPPRGTRKKNKSPLPPRPPPDSASTVRSDKENGGSTFNVSKRSAKVIFNLDKVTSCCQCSTSPFSGNDAHSEFYLPKLGLACACGQSDRASFAKNPTALSNILRSWQVDFLSQQGIHTAHQLLKAHQHNANNVARQMKKYREVHSLPVARSKECYVALMVWARTAKVVLRSIEKQKEGNGGGGRIEKPGFLDIAYSDAYTVGSVSTLGQLSSVGGTGRNYEMMEI